MPPTKLTGDSSKPKQNSISEMGLIIKLQDPSAVDASSQLLTSLLKKTPQLKIYTEEAAWVLLPKTIQKKIEKLSLNAMVNRLPLITVVGGDGTLLRCARYLLNQDAWLKAGLLGINAGRVGFLAGMNMKEAHTRLPKLLSGSEKLGFETRMCLKVEIVKKKSPVKTYHVLNDCVLSKGSLSRIFEFQVDVNSEPLSLYRADGLIISPPTGSTAYNLAAGGSIVEPHIPAIQLTPIAAQSFSNKPILISDRNTIELRLRRHTTDIFLTLDGHTGIRVDDDELVRITKSNKEIKFFIPQSELSKHFFHSLRQKLNWGIVPKSPT